MMTNTDSLSAAPLAPDASPVLAGPAAVESLSRLLIAMAPRRSVLLGLLACCETPQPLAVLEAEVERLQEFNKSVYGAASLCLTLEEAGGLERVTEDGELFAALDAEPAVIVDENGESRYEAPEMPPLFWRTTEAGRAVLAADDPVSDARAMLDAERGYLPIYARVLASCAEEGGRTTPQLGAEVDSDPLVQDPRLFAGHFIERLESVGCLAWRGSAWHTTELGRTMAEEIAAA